MKNSVKKQNSSMQLVALQFDHSDLWFSLLYGSGICSHILWKTM